MPSSLFYEQDCFGNDEHVVELPENQPTGIVIQKLRFLQLKRSSYIGSVGKTSITVDKYIYFYQAAGTLQKKRASHI